MEGKRVRMKLRKRGIFKGRFGARVTRGSQEEWALTGLVPSVLA